MIILETAALLTSRAGSRGFIAFVIRKLKTVLGCTLETQTMSQVTEQSFGIMSLGYIGPATLKSWVYAPHYSSPQSNLASSKSMQDQSSALTYLTWIFHLWGSFFMLHRMHICYKLITSLRIKQGLGQPHEGLQKHVSRLIYQKVISD